MRIVNGINASYFERSKGKSFLKNILMLFEGINKHVDEADLIDSSPWISKRPLKESFSQGFSGN